jgi:phosphodiesterase/alkaline phosphatase D-like protein
MLGFASPRLLWAQARLEDPELGSHQSGIALIRGWVCQANLIEIQIDEGPRLRAAYGTTRIDTRSVCGDDNNGFGLTFNWNLVSDGVHRVRAFADGVLFADVTFTVTTLGGQFLEGLSGECTVPNFPQPGSSVDLVWQESIQNFVIAGVEGGQSPFPYGLASGDVTSSSAVLWTRFEQGGDVTAEVSTSSTFQTLSLTSTVMVTADNDFTAKVTVSPLDPGQTYFYRWRQGLAVSDVGTFKTAPLTSVPANLRFAFTGDSDGSKVNGVPFYNNFETLDAARAEGLDFFVYLGDTIYSDFRGGGLPDAQTLDQFRALYKENRTIPALLNLLKATSTYAIWDDHEVRNDWDGQTVDPTFFAIGRKSFLEYMPTSEVNLPNDPACAGAPLFRVFRWGRDADMIILDERSCRSADVEAICSSTPGSPDLAPTLPDNLRPSFGLPPAPPPGCLAAISDPSRTLLGGVQKQLFKNALLNSAAKFKFIINEVPIQQLYALPYDRWEGYGAERAEILNFIRGNNIRNVIFLTTDLHANGINQVFIDNFADPTPIADEFLTGPVATNTLQEFIISRFGATGLTAINSLINIVGVDCHHLDAFSYGVVDVDASAGTATITLKDDTGAVLVDQQNPTVQCVKTIGP